MNVGEYYTGEASKTGYSTITWNIGTIVSGSAWSIGPHVLTSTSTTPTCTNDAGCTSSGLKKCSGNGYQTCGNYDISDSCLEWNSVINCASGQTCSNGQCIASFKTTGDLYNDYFAQNSKVKEISISNFDKETLDYFWQYLEELEKSGVINIGKPEMMGKSCSQINSLEIPDYFCDEYNSYKTEVVLLTQEEVKKILAAKTAHTIWIDKHNKVPWKLKDYTKEELNLLFNKNLLFIPTNGGPLENTRYDYYFYSVVDYSPSEAYNYANKFIKSNIKETSYSIIDDLRKDFHHSCPSCGDPIYAISLKETLNYRDYEGQRVARIGCGSVDRIIVGLFNSLNIPSYEDFGWYDGDGHSSGLFIGGDVGVLNHGDDIYDRGLTATPTNELLMDLDYFNEKVKPCGKYTPCAAKATRRFGLLQAINHISDFTLSACCDSKYGYDSCEEFLKKEYDSEYLTENELKNALTKISNLCKTRTAEKTMTKEQSNAYEYDLNKDALFYNRLIGRENANVKEQNKCGYHMFPDHVALVDQHKIKLIGVSGESQNLQAELEVDGISNQITSSDYEKRINGVLMQLTSISSSLQQPWQAGITLLIYGNECKGLLPRQLPKNKEGCGDSICIASREGKEYYKYNDDGSIDKNNFYVICPQDCGVNGEFIKGPICGDKKCESGEGSICTQVAGKPETNFCYIKCPQDCDTGFKNAIFQCYDNKEFNENDDTGFCKTYETWEGIAREKCTNACDNNGNCGLNKNTLKLSNSCGSGMWEKIRGIFRKLFGM